MNSHEMNASETSKFRALNRMVGATARDLELLDAIDETIAALDLIKEQMVFHTQTVNNEIERVKNNPHILDENGDVISSIEETRDIVGAVHAKFLSKCEAAQKDHHLHEDDGVVDAYYDMLNAAADLHNALNALCWVIGEHDADLERVAPSGPYSSAEDLFAALGV